MEERFKLLKQANIYLQNITKITDDEFSDLLGFSNHDKEKDIYWYHFGHMRTRGHLINYQTKYKIQQALEEISDRGTITKEEYKKFMNKINIYGIGLSIATRLLAFKRPDIFFCKTAQNITRIEQDFR